MNDLLEVHDARIAFDQCDADEPTLVASDHYGLSVTVSCSPASPRPRPR